MRLLLAAVEPAGVDQWRWLLSEEASGIPLADHTVAIDRRTPEWDGLVDLYGWVRWNADPDSARRIASEAALVDRVGQWITTDMLGESIVAAIAAAAPTTVRVRMPDELGFLRLRPLELAHYQGRALAADGEVAFVYDLTDSPAPSRTPPVSDGRLRMVAVFSQPDGSSMLALRRERYALTRLVRRLAATSRRAIDLEVLQYGVTRDLLAERVEADGGCDVLHISAHGSSDTLLLERPDGTPDPVETSDLIRLLRPTRGRVKLVVVSACESAAATIAETLQWLHVDTDTSSGSPEPAPTAGGTTPTPTIAASPAPVVEPAAVGLARRIGVDLGCAVVAMRYPVVDEFAIALAEQLYRNLFHQRLPLDTAIRRALSTTMQAGPTPARPPVSIATPALLTATPEMAGLRFDPPTRHADMADLRLVGFGNEPERFVGRAAAMAQATTALAPASGTTAVLFHGMAGAGKTACAVELAYRHRDRFAEAVFWQAPTRDDQWPNALPDLAITLEQRLGRHGFSMIDRIGSTESLYGFLPELRRLLTDHGLLLVLDNLETLLTPDGQWRDPRWTSLISALTGHSGESRVIMTSRVRPATLDPQVIVLAVHALSRDETVLLARELPNLNQLLHADGSATRTTTGPGGSADQMERIEQDRALVRRTLTVVQGHPKLLELADAAATNPRQLAAHLDAAEAAAVDDRSRLAAFLSTGDSSLDPKGFMTVLTGWANSTITTLPVPARLLLQALCTIEDDDRQFPVLTTVWPHLWTQLHPDSQVPDLADTAITLATAALIHPEPQPTSRDGKAGGGGMLRYRIHPGVADTVHAATPDPVVTATREHLAGFWTGVFAQARSGDGDADTGGGVVEHTGRVVRAGLSAVPYLIALHDYDTAGFLLDNATMRDVSPAVTHTALPYLRHIADATGRPDDLAVLARVVARVDPGEAEQLLRTALDHATSAGDHRLASMIGALLVDLLNDTGRLQEALAMADTVATHTRRAGLGPWTQLLERTRRLQILHRMGQSEQVLTDIDRLRQQMAILPTEPSENETVDPFNVREIIANLGAHAARNLGRWQDALDLANDEITSLHRRGASSHDVAQTRHYTYGPLLRLGHLDQAETMLRECQQVFEAHHDLAMLGATLSARAELADVRGHRHDAATLQHTALRLKYQQPRPDSIAISHHNLGLYITATDAAHALAHYLADTLIWILTGDTHHATRSVHTVADHLHTHPGLTPPATLADLAAVIDHDGIHYHQLIHTLTRGKPELADQALNQILTTAGTARTPPPADTNPDRHLAQWEPVLAALTAASHGDSHAAHLLTQFLDRYAEHPDWTVLVDRLRRIHTGDRDPDQLLAGLDPIDTAIIGRALDAADGRVQLAATPDQLTADPEDRGVAGLIAAVVAAARGDPATALTPVLDRFAADPAGAVLADRIRRILAGDRDPDQLLPGLDAAAAAVITAILDRLTRPTTSLNPPDNPTDHTAADDPE